MMISKRRSNERLDQPNARNAKSKESTEDQMTEIISYSKTSPQRDHNESNPSPRLAKQFFKRPKRSLPSSDYRNAAGRRGFGGTFDWDSQSPRVSPALIHAILIVIGIVMGWGACPVVRGQALTVQEIKDFTPVGVPLDKIGQYLDLLDEDSEFSVKWNRFAIHDPKTASEVREKQKTPEQKAQEQLAIMAITQSPEFLKSKQDHENKKDPKVKADEDQARAKARRAIEKPVEVGQEMEKGKDAKTKRRQDISSRAILSPREFNAEIEANKSAELKAKEAEIIRALTQPKEFLEERYWIKKTGLPRPPKEKPDPKSDNAQGQKANGAANGNGGGK